MRKIIVFTLLFCATYISCSAQKEIVYSLESAVIDSLQKGIDNYAKLLKKPEKDLKLFAVFIESNGEFEIYLQEYSHMPKSGFLELIQTSNRKFVTKGKSKVPILLPADKMSAQAKKDDIAQIPLSGYYIKIIFENQIQKVVETSILF